MLMSLDVIGWRSIEGIFMLVEILPWLAAAIMVGLEDALQSPYAAGRGCAHGVLRDGIAGTQFPGRRKSWFSQRTGASNVSTCSRGKTSV